MGNPEILRPMLRPPIVWILTALVTGCVHTHPVNALERDARKQDKAWSSAVAELPDDGRWWVHRTEALAVAADAVASFAPVVELDADRVRSDWTYRTDAGIDDGGEWYLQERSRVQAEVTGDQALGLSMLIRTESRRIRAGLSPAGWAGGDAPWPRPEANDQLASLESAHLARPQLDGDEARLRRVATELAPRGYGVVVDEPGRLTVERYLTQGATNKSGSKSASWHSRSQLELLITQGGIVDLHRKAEHRFDTDGVEGTWTAAGSTDELAGRSWIESLLKDPRSGLKLGAPLRDAPPATRREPTAAPPIPTLRTMPEIQTLIANEAVRTNTGDFSLCLVGALLPVANPAGGPWDPDPADPNSMVLAAGAPRTPADLLGPATGKDRTVKPLPDLGQVKREIPIVEDRAAQTALQDQAGALQRKTKAFSPLKLPMHPDVAGRFESGARVALPVVTDRLTATWDDACLEKRFQDGLPILVVELWDQEDEGPTEPLATCDLDLATVLAQGDTGVACGEARLFLHATYLFDMPQIELVGLPAAR